MHQDIPAAHLPETAHEPDWFEEWFRSDFYLKLYSHRNQQEAESCIDLILRSVGMDSVSVPRHTALDLAAGPGRHAIVLAERGFDVTAADLSPTLLSVAEREAREAGVAIRFLRSDMRTIEFRQEFDLVIQLFTSFGYFQERSDDALVLQRVRTALRDRGYYALDLINEHRLRTTLVPENNRTFGELTVREERRIVDGRVEKTITIPHPDGERQFMESVRLYTPETIGGMLREAGLEPIGWFGDYHGKLYDRETSDRMLIISRAQ